MTQLHFNPYVSVFINIWASTHVCAEAITDSIFYFLTTKLSIINKLRFAVKIDANTFINREVFRPWDVIRHIVHLVDIVYLTFF